ncbi:hypothetical protein [Streptomyces sp. NPDC001502]|uniref:hypothetical protein n=1 Tax=Streptomyces sp. NPDC001502 TaxID=3364578 RepID=UPI00368DE5EA
MTRSLPRRTFSPNEKYAALVERAGYLPLPLTAEDYLELLAARGQAVNSYGIKIKNRICDCEGLDGLRRGKSGITERKGLWEVRHDPYDIRLVWLRNNRDGGPFRFPMRYGAVILSTRQGRTAGSRPTGRPRGRRRGLLPDVAEERPPHRSAVVAQHRAREGASCYGQPCFTLAGAVFQLLGMKVMT